MANLDLYKLSIGGKIYEIPAASTSKAGLLSAEDYAKLANVAAGAQANVIEGIKVNGALLTLVEKIADILIAEGSANGTISVNGVDVAVKGLAALAYKSEVSMDDLAAALKEVINSKAAQTELNTLSGRVDTLEGEGEGSVKKAIDDAINKFATDITDNGVVDSFKELVDWVAAHGSEASEMTAGISANKTAIEALQALVGALPEGTSAKTIVEYIDSKFANVDFSNYYTKQEVQDGFVAKETGKGLSTNDYSTEDKNKLAGIEAGATKNGVSYDAASGTLTLTGFAEVVA